MDLATARQIAQTVQDRLTPFCERIEVVGSIRRGKPEVHDIDIVCIPSSQGQFIYQGYSASSIEHDV